MVIAFPCFRTAPTAASMAVEETGDDRTAPRRGRNAKEDGRKRLSWIARNGAQRQGKKVAHGRCGITIEAKPLSGQTCQIEPQVGRSCLRERHAMAARPSATVNGTLHSRDTRMTLPEHCLATSRTTSVRQDERLRCPLRQHQFGQAASWHPNRNRKPLRFSRLRVPKRSLRSRSRRERRRRVQVDHGPCAGRHEPHIVAAPSGGAVRMMRALSTA